MAAIARDRADSCIELVLAVHLDIRLGQIVPGDDDGDEALHQPVVAQIPEVSDAIDLDAAEHRHAGGLP